MLRISLLSLRRPVLTSSLVQSLKPRAVRTRFSFKGFEFVSVSHLVLEFSSFGFVSNFGSFDIAQDTFRASSFICSIPWRTRRRGSGMLCARCFPLTLARGEREWVRVDNLQITLSIAPQRDKWTIMADGKGSPTARLAHAVHRTLFAGQSLLLTGPLFSKLLYGLQIHNPVACGSPCL